MPSTSVEVVVTLSDVPLNVTVFRAYDVRGVYGTELTDDIATRVGKAPGSYLPDGRTTLVRGTRKSGPSMEKAFLKRGPIHRLQLRKLRRPADTADQL